MVSNLDAIRGSADKVVIQKMVSVREEVMCQKSKVYEMQSNHSTKNLT